MERFRDYLYTEAQIRQLEALAYAQQFSPELLMQRAGKAAFDWLRLNHPEMESVVVFCGSGNNGGDGYVFATLAHEADLQIKVRFVGDLSKLPEIARAAYQRCLEHGVDIQPFDPHESFTADLFVDALLGIGLVGEVREPMISAIAYINQQDIPVLSLDLPSGVQTDTGVVLGRAVMASYTITFIGIKCGLVTGHAVDCVGELICSDLELPSALFNRVKPFAMMLQWQLPLAYLGKRLRGSHKGDFGHTLLVGGDYGMTGALLLAALGALRVGSGLTSIATRPEHASLMNINYPEIMSHGVARASALRALLSRATVVVAGPGFGQSRWATKLLAELLKSELPLVLDADALNLLAKRPLFRDNWVLTPHPGEAARLLNVDTPTIQKNRFKAAQEIQKKYGGICVLKGAGTIVCSGEAQFQVCTLGNPGMASGGMGDLLSGIIAGLIAQKVPLLSAVTLAVGVHARAGDLASAAGERGMIATDLLPFIRQLMNATPENIS